MTPRRLLSLYRETIQAPLFPPKRFQDDGSNPRMPSRCCDAAMVVFNDPSLGTLHHSP